jgi:hypothetical protein
MGALAQARMSSLAGLGRTDSRLGVVNRGIGTQRFKVPPGRLLHPLAAPEVGDDFDNNNNNNNSNSNNSNNNSILPQSHNYAFGLLI